MSQGIYEEVKHWVEVADNESIGSDELRYRALICCDGEQPRLNSKRFNSKKNHFRQHNKRSVFTCEASDT